MNTTDPHSRVLPRGAHAVVQGYNAQAAATAGQIVVAAEVTATSNDQPHFVPMATAASENLVAAGHPDPVGAFVADAGYWTAAAADADLGANVLIATRKSAWRKENRPDGDRLAVLAKVNRGELSLRQAGAVLGVSPNWIADMTKRYSRREGQLVTGNSDPGPEQWMPVIEGVARGQITRRAAREELKVSATRITSMLAHFRGQATDPTTARQVMEAKLAEPENAALYRKRKQSIEPVVGNIKANLGYRRFTRRSLPAVNSEWRLICTAHNILKLRQAHPA